jgi:hypothetical protein
LKALYEVTGIDVFRGETFNSDEQMAWEVTAMSVHQLGAMGCYRAPAKHLQVFLAIDDVSVVPQAT